MIGLKRMAQTVAMYKPVRTWAPSITAPAAPISVKVTGERRAVFVGGEPGVGTDAAERGHGREELDGGRGRQRQLNFKSA